MRKYTEAEKAKLREELHEYSQKVKDLKGEKKAYLHGVGEVMKDYQARIDDVLADLERGGPEAEQMPLPGVNDAEKA